MRRPESSCAGCAIVVVAVLTAAVAFKVYGGPVPPEPPPDPTGAVRWLGYPRHGFKVVDRQGADGNGRHAILYGFVAVADPALPTLGFREGDRLLAGNRFYGACEWQEAMSHYRPGAVVTVWVVRPGRWLPVPIDVTLE